MSELMAATGLEKGGLYRHFKSKQSLAAAAFDYAWETGRAPRQRGLDDCNSVLDKLLLFVRNFVEESPPKLSGGCPLLNTAVESDDGNTLMRRRVRAALDQWRSTLAGFVRDGQASGELRGEIDCDAVAVIMISALEGAVMMSRLEKSREPLRKVGKHLESYLRALKS
jgi:TetR/AcrR family transcriptional regulator, transcriptional repressor for nem operon